MSHVTQIMRVSQALKTISVYEEDEGKSVIFEGLSRLLMESAEKIEVELGSGAQGRGDPSTSTSSAPPKKAH